MIYNDLKSIINKYQIIYADPPWHEQGGGKIKRGADRHYNLMKSEDIARLDVPSITDVNAHCYLWTTNNHLEDALWVLDVWKFQYKTMITWVKDKFGLGQYFRGNTEHCLFGVKGMLPYKIIDGKRQQATTSFFAKRTEHSKKPDEMYAIIAKVSDREGYNKIELFARCERPGWDVFGNQINENSLF